MQFKVMPDLERFPDFIMPKRATAHSAGFDLFAQEDMIITEQTTLFELGFKAAVPRVFSSSTGQVLKEYVGIIFPRSGLGAKFNCQLSNTLGVIDSDYRGQWMAALHLGGKGTKVASLQHYLEAYQEVYGVLPPIDDPEGEYESEDEAYEDFADIDSLVVKKGEAFAQVLFFEVPLIDVVQVTELDDTERGEGGFGSTTAPRA